jgi:hypothetical protein
MHVHVCWGRGRVDCVRGSLATFHVYWPMGRMDGLRQSRYLGKLVWQWHVLKVKHCGRGVILSVLLFCRILVDAVSLCFPFFPLSLARTSPRLHPVLFFSFVILIPQFPSHCSHCQIYLRPRRPRSSRTTTSLPAPSRTKRRQLHIEYKKPHLCTKDFRQTYSQMGHPQPSPKPFRQPSYLAQAYVTQPLTNITEQGDMAIVRDPYFWKRFSTAVHLDESKAAAEESDCASGSSTEKHKKYTDDWLSQQRMEKRRCTCISWIVGVAIVSIVLGAILGWYFMIGKNKML